MGSAARGQCKVFKSILIVMFVAQVIGCASSLPQRGNGNVQFPSNQQGFFSNPSSNGIVPIRNPNSNNNLNHGHVNGRDPSSNNPIQSENEFLVGTTGIACDKPGSFVQAPDGCNRCFCAENRQLSSACSRVFCPPGFPSSSQQG